VMREATQQEIEATRETTRLQIEATNAAARLQVEAALAQTDEARQRLKEQKVTSAKVVSGTMQALLERTAPELEQLQKFPSTTAWGNPVLTLMHTGLQDLKQHMPLMEPDVALALVGLEAELVKLSQRPGTFMTTARASYEIIVLRKHIIELKELAEKAIPTD
jgi:hypothetical protein